MHLFRDYLFLIPVVVALLSEFTKVVLHGLKTGNWHEKILQPGGMPSSHSAFVVSLVIIVGRTLGTTSPEFAIAFVFACLTWYDAMSSRRAIGEQAKLLNRLQHWEHLKERLGHSFGEVVGGIVFGTVVTMAGIWVSGMF
ncbi:divergent PAP2 family protein [Candidatus Peregrinibacteria bacterium]|nr:divergent PAP2 family protein [Candidatus Peregrinibacteria bacterium]MBI3816952.1 divergent PAP2 family protein [Candidatus Peregrinibacteria bacterium]